MFEVHLPNASPAGDPSPVVTKVGREGLDTWAEEMRGEVSKEGRNAI